MPDLVHLEVTKRGGTAIRRWRAGEARYGVFDLSPVQREGVLTGVRLRYQFLAEADLRNADLRCVDLTGTVLAGADLRCADLSGANLHRVDLRGANLGAARLGGDERFALPIAGTYTTGVPLNQFAFTDFRYAHFDGTYVDNANLSNAIGLATALHSGPSYISQSTLKRSRGALPVTFLQGCGFSDWEIEASSLYRDEITAAELGDIVYRLHDLRHTRAIQYFSSFIS